MSGFAHRNDQRSRRKIKQPSISPLSPRPNYDVDVDEIVEQKTLKTVTSRGIAQVEQELVSDLMEDLRKGSQLQLGTSFSDGRGFI